MTSTTATFASLMFAVAVVGFTATVESQDKAPAPVVEGQDQKSPTPHDSQENTAALPEGQEKTPGPTAPSPDKAPEPGGKQDQKSVVASEDRNYFHHGAIDLRGTLRAAWADVTGRETFVLNAAGAPT